MTSLADIRRGLRRGREERRRRLTKGERVLAWGYVLLVSLLAPVGGGLLVWGSGIGRGVGVALLAAGLIGSAVPISPFLRARVRRREARAGRQR